MKKMQCEVCGSNEIKKVADGVFECQSCGVQYSTEEVQKLLVEITGSVTIDHSKEAENMVKRAKQFEEKGNEEKAQEYYEKALDLDPKNEEAINATADAAYDALLNFAKDKLTVLEANISGEQAENNFLYYLYNRNKVISDVFTDIEIISRTEKYCPFYIATGNISGTFSGTACYRQKVPYTDYEEKTVRQSDGSTKRERVPVTKYRTEYDKHPANGEFTTNAASSSSISSEINSLITDMDINEIDSQDIAGESIGNDNLCRVKLFYDLEKLHATEIIQSDSALSKFKFELLKCTDGKYYYNNMEIDFNKNMKQWINRAVDQYKLATEASCYSSAKYSCPGDHAEDISYVITSNDADFMIHYVPIQIIEYAYKGDFYIAIQILHTSCNKIAVTYPINMETVDSEKEYKNAVVEANKTAASGRAAVGFFIGAIVFAVLGAIIQAESFAYWLLDIIFWILFIIFCALDTKNSKKSKKILDSTKEKILESQKNVKTLLVKTFNEFIDSYDKTLSVNEACLETKKQNFDLLKNLQYAVEFSSFDVAEITSKIEHNLSNDVNS